jgi:hypothetical protein
MEYPVVIKGDKIAAKFLLRVVVKNTVIAHKKLLLAYRRLFWGKEMLAFWRSFGWARRKTFPFRKTIMVL